MTPDELEQKIRVCDPAHPVQYLIQGRSVGSFGMSRRDYFAAAALTGLMANPNGYDTQRDTPEKASRVAYLFADAMLAAGKVGP